MPERIQATRSAMVMALVYLVPLSLWLAGQVAIAATGQAQLPALLRPLLPALLLLQACALALCTPWLLRYQEVAAQVRGLLMLCLVPLPLYSIAWASGVVEPDIIAASGCALLVLALCLYSYYRAVITLGPPGQGRGLLILSSQAVMCLLAWIHREQWLGMLGVHYG